MGTKTLHEALAGFGITSRAGTIPGKRILVQHGNEIGQFDAHEGWQLVNQLSGSPVDCPITVEAA